MSSEARSDLLHDLIRSALKAGADAAEAVVAERRSLSVGVRLEELEEVEREESRDLGLRIFVGRRQASVSASDLSPRTCERLVERAVAMARLAPEDPYGGLAPKELLAKGPHPELELYDSTEASAVELEERAREAESIARAVQGVTNSEGASASWSTGQWRLVTSHGFEGEHRGSVFSLSVGVIAGDESGMERGGEGRTTRWRTDLPSPEAIGRIAGERAVARLGARKIDSRTAPVIVENRIAASMLSAFVGAISGPSVARGVSFLKDKLGERIFAPGFRIVDDPFRPRGLGSAPSDDEGVKVEKRALVEDGVLTGWLLNSSSARQLGMTSTGHASRGLAGPPGVSTHNLYVEPGALDLKGLMREARTGLLVTSMFGPSLNANTGDWSAGVSGVWFEGGEPAYPVTEITIAGNLIEVYGRLVAGSDLEFRSATNSPSLLADAIAIAGR
ncbi:MAG TPA: TldD/PmbA family protein [Caulobacteraceae bacterium]|nr:TldD/PmbA family protein [Caulobacteraceae bacterium]